MREPEHDREARIVYVLCIACTAPFVTVAIARGEEIGPGTTIALIIAALGILGLVISWHRRPRWPRARALQRAKVAPSETSASFDEVPAPLAAASAPVDEALAQIDKAPAPLKDSVRTNSGLCSGELQEVRQHALEPSRILDDG